MRNRVKKLLAENVKYQKSDLNLMARLWFDDLKAIHYGGDIEDVSAIHFLNYLVDGHLTHWESATRIRRKLQAKHKELRDEDTYKGRKEEETNWRHKFSPALEAMWEDLG